MTSLRKKLLAVGLVLEGINIVNDIYRLHQENRRLVNQKGGDITRQLMSKHKLFSKKYTEKQGGAIVPIVHGVSILLKKHHNQQKINRIGRGMLKLNNFRKSNFTKRAAQVGAASVVAGVMFMNRDKLARNVNKVLETAGNNELVKKAKQKGVVVGDRLVGMILGK